MSCPFIDVARCDCHIKPDEHDACARYKAAVVLGALAIPDDMSAIDYAKIPMLIQKNFGGVNH